MVNQASRWAPNDYAQNAGFVPAFGTAVVEQLDPKPGELILDLGCGDGTLTAAITAAGASAVGHDSSPEMVEAARSRGVEAFVADAETLDLDSQADRFGRFDAVFSNAALHWMLDADAVATGVFAVLKENGRFVGEMGGAGNLEILRGAMREELEARGYAIPAVDPAWYPTVEEFTRLYAIAGFTEIRVYMFARPTDLPSGIRGWVKTFRSGLLDVAMVPEWERDDVAAAIERRVAPMLQKPDGTWFADYVRLRFAMRKPS
jgi:SAM-dependent methyltransferase